MKLMELVLARRITPGLEGRLAKEQYAYQHARSTEALLADLDRFVTRGIDEGWATYVMGLDIAGAFDSASLQKLVWTPDYYGVKWQ